MILEVIPLLDLNYLCKYFAQIKYTKKTIYVSFAFQQHANFCPNFYFMLIKFHE